MTMRMQLGPDWVSQHYGNHTLTYTHVRTGLRFCAVPGGSFLMGMSDVERDFIATYAHGYEADVEAQQRLALPARMVEVAPFLCMTKPMTPEQVRSIGGSVGAHAS